MFPTSLNIYCQDPSIAVGARKAKLSYRHTEGRVESEWTLITNGVSETKTTSIRVYGFRELTSLLSEVGFEVCEAFSSLDSEPYELGRRAYFIVRKI